MQQCEVISEGCCNLKTVFLKAIEGKIKLMLNIILSHFRYFEILVVTVIHIDLNNLIFEQSNDCCR